MIDVCTWWTHQRVPHQNCLQFWEIATFYYCHHTWYSHYLVKLWLLKKPLSSTIACLLVLWPRKKNCELFELFSERELGMIFIISCFFHFPQWISKFQPELSLEYLKNSGIIPPSAFFRTGILEEFLRHFFYRQISTFLVGEIRWAQNSARKSSRICQMSSITNLTFKLIKIIENF